MASPITQAIKFVCVVTFTLAVSAITTDTSLGDSTENPTSRGIPGIDVKLPGTAADAQDVPKPSNGEKTGFAGENETLTSAVTDLPKVPGSKEEEECCPNMNSTDVCTCTTPAGMIIGAYKNVEYITYTFDIGEPADVIVEFLKDDIQALDNYCTITIGGTVFSDVNLLEEVNYVCADTSIIVSGSYCGYKLHYYTSTSYAGENSSIIYINDTEGYLTPPSDDLGFFNYRPCTTLLWILQPDVPVSEFTFSFDYLDLGASYYEIHGLDKVNSSAGDLLLIGTGQELFGGTDQMFYGQKDDNFRNVVTNNNVSHVFFYSSTTAISARGFNISFATTAMEPTTPIPPTTTTNPPPPEELKTSILASIEGAPTNKSIINDTISNFKESMANMSSEYAKIHSFKTKDPITPDTVLVYEASTCNKFRCNPVCVAFNFSVAAVSPTDTWIFTANVLEDMMVTPELQYALKHIGDDCEICDADPELNLWLYITIPVGIVLIAVLLSMALWYMGQKTNIDDSRKKYEQEIADRKDDNRRRSSCDVSILGLGGSIASRGSLYSRRFTMPFPKANREEANIQEEGEDGIDMSGFKEYDPDLGRVDPAEFGIAKEFLGDDQDLGQYGNPGFVDEEDDERTVFRRGQSSAMAAGTDSEDSDGGAVSFSASMKKKNKIPTAASVQADVHMTDDAQMTMMGTTGETAL